MQDKWNDFFFYTKSHQNKTMITNIRRACFKGTFTPYKLF